MTNTSIRKPRECERREISPLPAPFLSSLALPGAVSFLDLARRLVLPHRANPRADWTAADWRAHFEERAGIREFDGGMIRAQAEREAFYDLAVEWIEAHPEVDTLPTSEAWPIVRAALEALGIEAPATLE